MPQTKAQNVFFTLLMAFVLEFFVVERLSQKLAFRLVTPGWISLFSWCWPCPA